MRSNTIDSTELSHQYIYMQELIMNNPISRPQWLIKSSWFGDKSVTDRTIHYPNFLSMQEKTSVLRYQSLGQWCCPSGMLLSVPLILDLKYSLKEDSEHIIHVPKSPCEVSVIWAGDGSYFEQAYVSLRWADAQGEIERAVIPRKDSATGEERDIFFVDKSLFCLFDYAEFKSVFHSESDVNDYIASLLEPGAIPRPNPLVFLKTPSGVLSDSRSGTAAAIIEFDEAKQITALHFDFILLHSSGEDGEYDDDWEYAQEARELIKRIKKD